MLKTSSPPPANTETSRPALLFEERQILARAASRLGGDLGAALSLMAQCAYPASDKEIEHYVSVR